MKPELKTTNQSQILRELCEELGPGWDTEKSEKILKAVLNALRERLNVEESVNLLRILPKPLKDVYVDGWNVKHPDSENEDDFVETVRKSFSPRHSRSVNILEELPLSIESVFRVIRRNIIPEDSTRVVWMFPSQMDYMLDEDQPLFI